MNETTGVLVLLTMGIGGFLSLFFGALQLRKYTEGISVFTALKEFETLKTPTPSRDFACLDFNYTTEGPGHFSVQRSKSTRIRHIRLAESNAGLLFITPFSGAKLLPWSQFTITHASIGSETVFLKLAVVESDLRIFLRIKRMDFDESFLLKKQISTEPDPDTEANQLLLSQIQNVSKKWLFVGIGAGFISTLVAAWLSLNS